MKKSFLNIFMLILVLFISVFKLEMKAQNYSSGKGDHLLTLYEYPVPLPNSLKGKKVNRITYKGNNNDSEYDMKFIVHQNGIKMKVEEVEYRELSDNNYNFVTLGTLFTANPKVGKVYSFAGLLPEGVPSQRLTLEYKGKTIKYYLHYGLRIVMSEESDPEDSDWGKDVEVVELYSGDRGDE